jgi:Tfp pilus assembly protein PilF
VSQRPAGRDLPASETYPLAKTHALRALALDPHSAYARRALAAASHWYDFDHVVGEQQFRAAIAETPNDAGARNWYAKFLIDMRRFDEALDVVRGAEEQDPGWLLPVGSRGNVLLYSGRPEKPSRSIGRRSRSRPATGSPATSWLMRTSC